MAFLPNIPQATDALSTSQGDILNNFTILGAIAGNTNPSSASINSTAGFNWISLPTQGATPPTGSAFPAGNIGIYNASASITGQIELFVNKTNAGTTQIPITASILSTNPAPGSLSNGYSYLPSGVLLQWGYSNLTGGPNPQTISFPKTFPGLPIIVLATPYNTTANGFIVTGSLTQTTFNVAFSVSAGAVQWLAIGY